MDDTRSVYELFQRRAAAAPGAPFLHIPAAASRAYADGPVDLTYGEALAAVERLKAAYAGAGYSGDRRVALLLENRAAFFVHWLALNGLGVSVVPVNGEFSPAEAGYLLSNSDACLAVTLASKRGLLEEAAASAGLAPPIVDAPDDGLGVDTFAPPKATGEPSGASQDYGGECAVLYTSGSTGQPKGCLLSNEYFLAMGRWYRDIGGLCAVEQGRERLITPLPLTHMNALACSTMAMIETGGCVVQLDRFHPSSWWDSVRSSGATIVHYLGVMPAILLNMPPTEAETAHAVKFGFGAGVNPKHHAPFEARFGFPLIEAWAMTETGAGGCIIANHEPRHVGTSCFGKPEPAVETRIVDEEGRDVAPGRDGELLVRAAGQDPRKGFFTAYHKNPEETEKAWAGGWLHTGDVVRVGPDGSFHFVDRRKNVIRRSGENISALEVEAVLSLDPAIEQVVAAAVPDEIRGDEVMALIILKPGQAATRETAEAIFAATMDQLVYFKTPGYIAFVDAFPLTASQKPKRADVKALCRRLVEADEAFDLRDLKKRPKAERSAAS